MVAKQGVSFLFFLSLTCWLGAGDVVSSWSVSPTGVLIPPGVAGAADRFAEDRHVATSPNGLFRAVASFDQVGLDEFTVSRLEVWRGDSLLWTLERPEGNGFYVSNRGFVAAVRATEALTGEASIALYGPAGSLLFSEDLRLPHFFGFSADGATFAVAAGDVTLVLDGRSGSTRRLPPVERFALGENGSLLAGCLGGTITVWRCQNEVLELRVDSPPVRALALLDSLNLLAVVGRQQLCAYDLRTGTPLFERHLPGNRAFREVRFVDDRLVVGIQERTGQVTAGVLWVLSPDGEMLLQKRAAGSHPRKASAKEKAEGSRRPETEDRPEIGWPFPPFDQVFPIGNSYEEYLRYGRDPYPHPGVDLMSVPYQDVYAVSPGIVKAVLTISADYHWRVAVGDSATADTTEGWLYAHLLKESIAVGLGDTVRTGDYLGLLVPWPSHDFDHLHFVKVRQAGEVWSRDWDAAFNPLDVLRPRTDPEPPVFEPITIPGSKAQRFAYCVNESSQYLPADTLRGDVDIIVRVGDHIGAPDWKCSIYELRYWLKSIADDTIVVGPVVGAHLSHVIPNYLATPEFVHVLYKDDEVLRSEGNYTARVFYHVVTNTDGDSLLELTDAQQALVTTSLADGPYWVFVEARDAYGNVAVDSEVVVIRNNPAGVVADAEVPVPVRFRLAPAFPNPFNNRVTLRCQVSAQGRVVFEIRDVRGRLVQHARLWADSGVVRWAWNGRDRSGQALPSGVYVCTARHGRAVRVQKLLLLR